jgi:hypothetical protein
MKYYLSVGAIFKNESMILKEWIEHYLHHGFEHIYLINENLCIDIYIFKLVIFTINIYFGFTSL